MRVLVLGLCVFCVPRVVAAACEAQAAPLAGATLERCTETDAEHWRLHVELATVDLGLVVSRPSERARTVERWVAETPGVRVAVQAGDFDFPSYAPEGLTVGEGEVWSDTADDGQHALLGFDSRGVGLFVPPRQLVPAEPWMDDVLSGPMVLRDGVPVDCEGRGCERRSRTGVGLDATGRQLVIVVALGDRPTRVGVNDAELGALLRDAGAHRRAALGSRCVVGALRGRRAPCSFERRRVATDGGVPRHRGPRWRARNATARHRGRRGHARAGAARGARARGVARRSGGRRGRHAHDGRVLGVHASRARIHRAGEPRRLPHRLQALRRRGGGRRVVQRLLGAR
ncbi:MAG: phosphodiester glycosidase family protein [Sandaracinus sp.]|nr:phosphodiester glycosidase family protein [Sandaracinus sp.]